MECHAVISRTTLLCGVRLGLFSLAAVAGMASPGWAQLGQVVILTDRDFSNGVTTTSTYVQSFIIAGTGISSVTVTPPNDGAPFSLPPGTGGGGPSFELDSPFSTLQDLQTAYRQGVYTLSIAYGNGSQDSVSLLFNPQPPTSFAIPTSPLPLAALFYSSPSFAWNSVPIAPNTALGCEITDPTGFYKYAVDAPYDIGETSWTPTVELAPGTPYDFDLSVYQQGDWGSNQYTLKGNNFAYYGIFGNNDITQFTASAVPEPGSIALLLGGLGLIAFAWQRRRRAT